MNAEVRRSMEMADRVVLFGQSYPSDVPSVAALFERLQVTIERGRELVKLQVSNTEGSKTGTERQDIVRRRLNVGLLRMISRAGKAAAVGNPGLATGFARIPPGVSREGFVAAAESLIAAARSNLAALEPYGVSEPLVDEAQALLAKFASAVASAASAYQARVAARAELDTVPRRIGDIVGRLDGVIRHRHADDPQILEVWASAKHIGGPSRTPTEPPVDGAPTTPLGRTG